MTEPDGDDGPDADETRSQLDAALGRFKPREAGADTTPVSENGRAGLTWNPVTDGGGADTAEAPPRSTSFQFDLGSALARLGGADEPSGGGIGAPDPDQPAEPLPVRGRQTKEASSPEQDIEAPPSPGPSDDDATVAAPLPTRPPAAEPSADVVEPLPTRKPPVEPVPEAEPLPTRSPVPEPANDVVEPLPTRTRSSGPAEDGLAGGQSDTGQREVVDRLPTRTPRSETPPAPVSPAVDGPPTPAEPQRPSSPQRSVFEDPNPMPSLPTSASAPATTSTVSPTLAGASTAPAGDVPFLPTLPPSAPAAPPPVIAPIESAPSTPQLNALRSAQLRANRNDRHGKLFGRSLLALLVVGALVAAAMLFGRSYLFPTEWSAELTPIVDEVQSARGGEFEETLALVERPASEYAPLVTTHVLGRDWSTRLPEWRALGLAGGDGAVADVQTRVANLYPAFYDADAGQIVASADRTAEARAAALRVALEAAYADQTTDGAPEPGALGLTGLDAMDVVARRAFDATAADLLANAPDAVADLAGVPLPVAYRLRAVDALGSELVGEAGTARPGDPLPAAAARLDDGATRGAGGLLQPGDQPVLDPTALGADDWALIWGTRLSPAVAGRMADSIRADSYSVVNRSGATCFVAVFETVGDANALFTDVSAWAAAAPVGAQTVVSQLATDRVQLEGCDPGADAAVAPATSAVDLVVARQLDRLAG